MAKNLIIPEKIKLFNIDVVNTYINDDTFHEKLKLDFSVAHNTKHNLKEDSVKMRILV